MCSVRPASGRHGPTQKSAGGGQKSPAHRSLLELIDLQLLCVQAHLNQKDFTLLCQEFLDILPPSPTGRCSSSMVDSAFCRCCLGALTSPHALIQCMCAHWPHRSPGCTPGWGARDHIFASLEELIELWFANVCKSSVSEAAGRLTGVLMKICPACECYQQLGP